MTTAFLILILFLVACAKARDLRVNTIIRFNDMKRDLFYSAHVFEISAESAHPMAYAKRIHMLSFWKYPDNLRRITADPTLDL